MMKNNKIYFYFFKSSLLLTALFFISSFTMPKENKYSPDGVSIKVEQENNDVISVSVKAAKDNKMQFFMFNVEGELIKELNIDGSKKVCITQLQKGLYMYEFFSKDARLKSGNIELK